MSLPVEDMAPINARGTTYYLTAHAADRALEMGVPLQLIPTIINTGELFDAPAESRYAGCYVYRAGKVAVAIRPTMESGHIITTVLWATVDAWREAECKAGREYRGDEWTRNALDKWFGDAA